MTWHDLAGYKYSLSKSTLRNNSCIQSASDSLGQQIHILRFAMTSPKMATRVLLLMVVLAPFLANGESFSTSHVARAAAGVDICLSEYRHATFVKASTAVARQHAGS
jgi:hypothetical protein